jgi:signal transduction histidine kinase
MKLYIILIILTTVIAFFTAYFVQDLDSKLSASDQDVISISKIKIAFQEKVLPVKIVNFSSLYYNRERLELVDPNFTAPVGDFVAAQNIFSGNHKCFKTRNFLSNFDNFDKVWIWEEFRCGMRKLPNSFFSTPPYIHPSGKSYALLAHQSKRDDFAQVEWVKEHISFFHILEYQELGNHLRSLDSIYTLFSKLDGSTLSAIINAKGTILTHNYLLARIKYNSLFPILEYRFYHRDDLDQFVKTTPYEVLNYKSGEKCFYKDGALCWNYSFTHRLTSANKKNIILITVSLGLVVTLIIVIINRLKAQRLEDERRKLALQVLTHEFRTPVSSLLLGLENLNRQLDNSNPELQDIYLKLSKDAYRLKRLTEMSRNYLKSSQKKGIIEYNLKNFEDINFLIEEVAAPYEEAKVNLSLELAKETVVLHIDPYWFSISLKNLIENAIDHGGEPIVIKTKIENDFFSLSVIDQGQLHNENFEKLTSEFFKGNKSTGTGLGLSIVRKSIEGMDGKFSLSTQPTQFVIQFKVVKV